MSWLAAAVGLCAALALQIAAEAARGRVGRGRLSHGWSQGWQTAARLPLAVLILLGAPVVAYAVTAAMGTVGAAAGAAFADFLLAFVIMEYLLEVYPAMAGRVRDSDFRRWEGEGTGGPAAQDLSD